MTHSPADAANLTALAQALTQRGWRMVSAESCTGGLIAASCTSVCGASDWFDGGWVTYSNAAKTEQLAVPAEWIEQHGAVSQVVVQAMALGAQRISAAHVSVAVTGIAGPGGGHADKPVGTVWFGWCVGQQVVSACEVFAGDRQAVREQAVTHALRRLVDLLTTQSGN